MHHRDDGDGEETLTVTLCPLSLKWFQLLKILFMISLWAVFAGENRSKSRLCSHLRSSPGLLLL